MSTTSVQQEEQFSLENTTGSDGDHLEDSPTKLTDNSTHSPGGATKGIDLPFGSNNEVIGQPSSPSHNYRHSRAYRHFKNPPQPHMCIRVTTVTGEEVFINVLSWTRIVVPQEPTDPIPLYGGMKVPPGSPRCPSLVYAVMANPEVLKDSGRHSKDPEERRAMVELMCDFVEAMNPDLKLNRNAVILKDRDISGELKDVWNAVQAQRDREREEQIMQHHNHVPPPQQMFLPQKQDSSQCNAQPLSNSQNANASDNKITYMEFGPDTALAQTADDKPQDPNPDATNIEQKSMETNTAQSSIIQSAINNNANNLNSVKDENGEKIVEDVGMDLTDSAKLTRNGTSEKQQTNMNELHSNKSRNSKSPVNESPDSKILSSPSARTTANPASPTTSAPTNNTTTTTSSNTTNTTTVTKKEKLGGFLPNTCIFPRFKNKHKDKDKEKEKDKNSTNQNSKEKTLLNSLKKTTTAATNAFTKSQSHNDDHQLSQVNKHCLNLEAQVEKLDLNKMETSSHTNDVLIKVATSAAK